MFLFFVLKQRELGKHKKKPLCRFFFFLFWKNRRNTKKKKKTTFCSVMENKKNTKNTTCSEKYIDKIFLVVFLMLSLILLNVKSLYIKYKNIIKTTKTF